MEFSWSTFLIEIINFLILVWILKRFLYRPVLDIIARRREQIRQNLKEAEKERQEAQGLQQQYQGRLSEWEQEKEAARRNLQRELDQKEARLREAMKTRLEEERRKVGVLEQRERERHKRRLEEQALALGGRFASQLLARMAGPELEGKLVETALQDLAQLPDDQRDRLRQTWQAEQGLVKVASAYPLESSRRAALEKTLSDLVGGAVSCEYHEDRELIAGLRVSLGFWVVRANIQDELASFAEAGRE